MTFDWNANWPFLLQVTLPGKGLQKPISKWIPNSLSLWLFYLLDDEATRVILTQPLHHCMPVLRNVSRDLQAWTTPVWTNWPTCLQVNLHAKNTTKTCKKWNESKTTQQSYLDYEWGFPRVQSNYSKLISRCRKSKRPVTVTSTQLHWPQERLELELWIWMYDWILLLISYSDSWMSG
jgi:hypothetical protein